jgi:hypothetical protein
MDGGTGGIGTTGGVVKFIDYPIFQLDSTIQPVDIEECRVIDLKNTIFVNTSQTL